MHYHVARDGQQLGRISEADLKAGLPEGRYLATDLAWAEGMAQWTPLSELIPGAAPAASSAPLPAPSLGPRSDPAPSPAPGAVPRMARPPVGAVAFGPTENAKGATLSLISGIVSIVLCGLGGIATLTAIITGHLALSRIERSGGVLGGRGKAMAGLILGYVSIISSVIGLAIFASLAVPVFAKVQEKGIISKQISIAKYIHLACKEYAADNGGKYPATLEELVEKGHLPAAKLEEANTIKPSGWLGDPGFQYLGAGKDDTALAETEILISNAESRRGERIVAYHDGSVVQTKPE